MKVLTLIGNLFRLWLKYGNCKVDLILEDSTCQTEMPLGDIAYSSREKRIKLLSEGFS